MLLSDFPVPNTGIQHKQENTQAFVDGNDVGNGTLYIAESQVTWVTAQGSGFSLEYPKICLHAISRDLTSFPQECLFVQVDGKLLGQDADGESDSSSEGDDDDMPTTEVRFVPEDKRSLESIYKAMSDCQILHPDPEDADSDEFGNQGEFYEGVDRIEQLTEQGQMYLQRFERMLQAGQGDAPSSEVANGNDEGDYEDANDDLAGGQFDDADMEHQS